MFGKNLLIATFAVALSTTAFAQAPKKANKKAKAAKSAAAPTATPAPVSEATPAPTPMAEPPKEAPKAAEASTANKPVRTLFNIQTHANVQSLTVKASYESASTSLTAATGGATLMSVSATGFELSGEYEYGFTDNYSAAIRLGYDSQTQSNTGISPLLGGGADQSIKTAGLEDVMLIFRGLNFQDQWTLVYGLGLGVNLSKGTFSDKTNTGTSGSSSFATPLGSNSGGLSIDPYVGADFRVADHHILGVKVDYLYPFTRTITDQTVTPNVDDTLTGGSSTTIQAYYEYQMEYSALDVAIGTRSLSTTTTTTPTNTAGTTNVVPGALLLFGVGYGTYINPTTMLAISYLGISTPSYNPTANSTVPSFLTHVVSGYARFYF